MGGGQSQYRGMFKTGIGVVQEEVRIDISIPADLFPMLNLFQGLLMLWRGMLPAIYRHAVYTGTEYSRFLKITVYLFFFRPGFRMSAYEEIRTQMCKKDKDGFPLWKKVIAGMMAGGIIYLYTTE